MHRSKPSWLVHGKECRTDFVEEQHESFVGSATDDGFLNLRTPTAERVPSVQHLDYHISRFQHLDIHTHDGSTQPPTLHRESTYVIHMYQGSHSFTDKKIQDFSRTHTKTIFHDIFGARECLNVSKNLQQRWQNS